MRKSIDSKDWHIESVKGRVYEVCVSTRTNEIVVLGSPDAEDESHNCDFMGCGKDHVLWRRKP